MERDIVIVVEGGAMLGVFGAGVVTALHEANIYDRIDSVYGVSAGAHDLAYFLAAQKDKEQARWGSSIYYEDLAGNALINIKRFFPFLGGLIASRFGKKKIPKVVDIDYLMHVEQTNKRLDVSAIQQQPIAFRVAAFNTKTCKVDFLDGKQDTLMTLKASASTPPYYPYDVVIRGQGYLDGSYMPDWDIHRIINQYRHHKIIFVINKQKKRWRSILMFPLTFTESLLMTLRFGWRVGRLRLVEAMRHVTIEQLRSYPNMTVVANDLSYPNRVTDKEKLLTLYHHGLAKGQEALKTLRLA